MSYLLFQTELLMLIEEQIYNESTEQHGYLTDIFEYRVEKIILLYIPPLLFIIGMCGNSLSLFILLSKSLRRQTTNIFYAALAFVDSIVLCVGLARIWFGEITGVHIERESSSLCKAVSMITFSSSQLSSWLIIAVTIIRYIAVSSPHKAVRYCNRRLAKRIIMSLATVIILMNLHFVWTVQIQENGHGESKVTTCDASKHTIYFVHIVWPWIDTVMSVLAPFILIASFNALIVINTIRATKFRRNSLSMPTNNNKFAKRSDIKITVTLLAVSFSFILTTLPMAVVMLLQTKWMNDVHDPSVTMQVISRRRMIRTIAEMLMYLNHSVNFFLYCTVGQNFRDQLSRTLCKTSSPLVKSSSNHNIHLLCSRKTGKLSYGRRRNTFSRTRSSFSTSV